MKSSDGHSLASRGRGRGTAYPGMYDEATEVDHDGGRRDHREGVYDDTHAEEITLQGSYTSGYSLHG